MKKEIIVCIIIVIAIIVGNIVTQNYTVKSIGILSEELEELKKDIIEAEENGEEEVNENIKNKKEEIKKEWENRHDKLAYFIEHDELEKVKTDLTALNSFIETKEYAEAISELDKCVFVLKHIEDKYAFNLQNVFLNKNLYYIKKYNIGFYNKFYFS